MSADRLGRYAEAALAGACAEVTSAPAGGRNRALATAAFGIGRLVGGGVVDAESATTALQAAALEAGLAPGEARMTIASGLRAGQRSPRSPEDRQPDGTRRARPKPSAAPEPGRPPAAEVAALWQASSRLYPAAGPPSTNRERVRAYLDGRGLESDNCGLLDACRALPDSHEWPEWWPAAWSPVYSLAVAAYSADGALASIHARAVVPVPEGRGKTRWPRRCNARELLFADGRALALLRGEPIQWMHGSLVTEGLTDFLKGCLWAATHEARRRQGIAVLGIAAGGAAALASVRWPAGLPIGLAFDDDEAGERYVQAARRALPASLPVRRIRLASGAP